MKKMWLLVWNTWFKIPEKLRFLLVGGFNTVISYFMFLVFTLILGNQRYQICLVFAWIVSSVISFSTQKIFVFCTRGQWLMEYYKCCMSWMIAYLINAGILEISVRCLRLTPYIGQFLSLLITTVVTYILFKKFAFKRS